MSKNKSVARANSLHHGILLREGTTGYENLEDLVHGELVDKTITKKGWEPAALYVLGDKAHLRVSEWFIETSPFKMWSGRLFNLKHL